MTTPRPPDRPRRPEKDAADQPREPERRDAPTANDDEQPDFSSEFDHPSGRLDETSRWEP